MHPEIRHPLGAGHDGFFKANPSILCLEYIRWAVRHGRNASVRRLDHPPVVCTPVFDPVQPMIRGDFKEMEVHHTHSFISLMYPSLRVNTLSWLNLMPTTVWLKMPVVKAAAALLLVVFLLFWGNHWQFNFHFTLYTLHSTLDTLHSTLYTSPFTFSLLTPHTRHFTLHFALCTLHSALHTPHWTLYTSDSALHYIPHSTPHYLHTPHFTLHLSLHWYGHRGKIHKTVEIICFTKKGFAWLHSGSLVGLVWFHSWFPRLIVCSQA